MAERLRGSGWSVLWRRFSVPPERLTQRTCELSFDESISEAYDGLDLTGGHPQLVAEPSDVHIHRPGFHEPVVSPDTLEQSIPGDHPVSILHQIPEQLEL